MCRTAVIKEANLAMMLALLLLLIGNFAHGAYGKTLPTIKVVGDRVYHPKAPNEFLQTYVVLPRDHTSQTLPVAVGVELTDGFVRGAINLPLQHQIEIPLDTTTTFNYSAYENFATHFPAVGKNPFTFLYWSFGFNGHPPVGVYDTPHFDMHFMFPSADYWWTQHWGADSQGPCMGGSNATFFNSFKPIPASCWPGNPAGPVLQTGDFVWGMGSHLIDFSGPEFNPPRTFNHTQIYGQYNGEIAYFEIMVALHTMKQRPGYKECVTLKSNPTAMPVPRDIPGQLCLERKGRSFYAEYRSFAPAAVGCSGPGVGAYPAGVPKPPASICSLPASS